MASKNEGSIRRADPRDLETIRTIVDQAYRIYVPDMDNPPGPMLDDYGARIAQDEAFVLEIASDVAAILVLIDRDDYLLLDNVAVAPGHQGEGLGRRLVAFAEAEARERGYGEIRLYTHVVMAANVPYYESLGWEETHRAEEDGYQRIFMRKLL